MTSGSNWGAAALIYQIYVRSFADSDGDGIGDLAGIRSRLDYLVELGVDAVWLTPFYPSPMVDGGYDVADYRGVDPRFGTLEDFDELLAAAHERGLRVITDVVPNHTSDRHAWFREALASAPGSAARDRFVFRPGRGPGGAEPPNNWRSVFGGPAWTRLPDGEWYLHLFAPEQPDLDWENPEVREEFADVLRFWLDRGVDGIRVDVAHGLIKPDGLPDTAFAGVSGNRPYFDQDGVHEVYREWRKVLDSYEPARIMVAEARLRDVERVARYARPDEMDQAFNFAFLWAPWSLDAVRDAISRSIDEMAAVGKTPTWVFGNHDEVRAATRLAAEGARDRGDVEWFDGPDLDGDLDRIERVGLRRARAMALLSLALPGSAYLYQGDELGLPQAPPLPAAFHEDPIWHRSGGTRAGRDECRIPMPWDGDAAHFGFSPEGGRDPWLPQPSTWGRLSVAEQRGAADSTLSLYQRAIALRRTLADLRDGAFALRPAPEGILAFTRGPGFACAVNFNSDPVPLERLGLPGAPILSSAPVDAGMLPPDCAVWTG